MFNNCQLESKIDLLDKRTNSAHLAPMSTSIITAQKLARLKFQRRKGFKFSWRPREVYQLK